MLRAEIILGAKVRTSLTEDLDQLKAYRALITDTHNQNFFIVTNTNKEIHTSGKRIGAVNHNDLQGEEASQSVNPV